MFDNPNARSLLRRIFHVFGSEFLLFVLLALLVQSPILFLNLALTTQAGQDLLGELLRSINFMSFSIMSGLASAVLTTIAAAVLVYGVFQTLRGKSLALGRSFQIVAVRTPEVVMLSLMSTLVIALGFVFLFFPGFVATAGLFVAAPVLMIEGEGPIASLHRSWDLTAGYKLSIIGVMIGLGAVKWLVNFGLTSVAGQIDAGSLSIMADYLGNGFGTALTAVAAAVIYHDLRGFREGLDEDDLAAIFD